MLSFYSNCVVMLIHRRCQMSIFSMRACFEFCAVHACYWSRDAPMARCSMLCRPFSKFWRKIQHSADSN